MAFSYNTWTGAKGQGDEIEVTFPFLSRDYVSILVDGEVVPSSLYQWTSDSLIECLAGFPSGSDGRIQRFTPRDGLPAQQQGSGAFDWQGANNNDTYVLHIQQEIDDSEAERQAVTDDLVDKYDNIDTLVSQAQGFRDAASGYADDAQGWASAASSSAGTASGAASTATTKAGEALASALAASNSEDNAATSEGNAQGWASAASSSAGTASGAASTATTKAGEALASALAASNSEDNAATSEGNAAQSEANALAYALQAEAHADNAYSYSGVRGFFKKTDPLSVAWKLGGGGVQAKAGTIAEVNGSVYHFTADTQVTLPTLVVGTDYAIWIRPDGVLVATSDHVSPPVANSRKLGGFHYAPGGNATGTSGGNTTPTINPYSFWDLKFRPSCPDPRGMVLVAGRFWVDIYLLGVNHHTDGTSKYNVAIADGSSPPKVPALFGGNGSTAYGSLNWWEASEVMQSHGKDLLSYAEFAAMAYGTTENTSGGTDPVSTILRQAYTSKWGVMLATGNLWVWGRDFGGNFAAASWADNNGGRGQTHTLSNASLFGGYWVHEAYSGSRCSGWNNLPSNSNSYLGARGRSDHLCHE